jgi:hypothetical protein
MRTPKVMSNAEIAAIRLQEWHREINLGTDYFPLMTLYNSGKDMFYRETSLDHSRDRCDADWHHMSQLVFNSTLNTTRSRMIMGISIDDLRFRNRIASFVIQSRNWFYEDEKINIVLPPFCILHIVVDQILTPETHIQFRPLPDYLFI